MRVKKMGSLSSQARGLKATKTTAIMNPYLSSSKQASYSSSHSCFLKVLRNFSSFSFCLCGFIMNFFIQFEMLLMVCHCCFYFRTPVHVHVVPHQKAILFSGVNFMGGSFLGLIQTELEEIRQVTVMNLLQFSSLFLFFFLSWFLPSW